MTDPAPAADRSRPPVRRALIGALALVVATFVLLSIVSQVGSLDEFEWRFEVSWLLAAIVLLVLLQAMHAELWRRILHDLGGPMPAARAWRIWNLSLLARYVPTQILMAVTRIAMCERSGTPRRVTAASIVYEFAIVVGTAAALSLAWLLDHPNLENEPWRFVVLAAPIGLLVGLHPRVFSRLSEKMLPRLGSPQLERFISVGRLAWYVAAYVVSFIVGGLAVVALLKAIHPVGDVPVVLLGAYAVGYAASVLAFAIPGGLGARDAAMASVLSLAVPFGVALAAALVVRIVQTLVEVAFAAASPLLGRLDRAGASPMVPVEP